MDMTSSTNMVEIAKAFGAVATPLVVAVIAYNFQHKQKIAEATAAERNKRLANLSPHLNAIFSYRQRLGDFLIRSPEDILEAKRAADREFWTFQYLWSQAFKDAYKAFLDASFETFRAEGSRAGIRAESKYYPIPASTSGWKAFTEQPVDNKQNRALYESLQSVIANDLGIRG